jgi:hypothetical protein
MGNGDVDILKLLLNHGSRLVVRDFPIFFSLIANPSRSREIKLEQSSNCSITLKIILPDIVHFVVY